MKIMMFEHNVETLYPITLTRAAFDISIGAITLYKLFSSSFDNVSFVVGDLVRDVTLLQHKNNSKDDKDVLFINSRLVPRAGVIGLIKGLIKANPGGFFVGSNDEILVSFFPDSKIKNSNELAKHLGNLKQIKTDEMSIVKYPWDIVIQNEEIINENLDFLSKNYSKRNKDVFVGKNVKIKNSILDTSDGKIIVDDNTVISDFACIKGPVYIGKDCRINEHACIKEHVTIRDTCKIGGEVECSVIESFSNKQHYGFLGHAYLGSWVNIGAGTTNSDLKNTYGTINVVFNNEKISTGRQFFGCVIGDYSKTAINVSIFTGKIIGVNSHIFGNVVENVPSFTNYAKSFGCIAIFNLDAAIKTQHRMFGRRKIEQKDGHITQLKQVFSITEKERKSQGIIEEKFTLT